MKAEFQREFKEIHLQQQPELHVKEFKQGRLPISGRLPQEAVVTETVWAHLIPTVLLQDLLVEEVFQFGASLTPRLPSRTKQAESFWKETEPRASAG